MAEFEDYKRIVDVAERVERVSIERSISTVYRVPMRPAQSPINSFS